MLMVWGMSIRARVRGFGFTRADCASCGQKTYDEAAAFRILWPEAVSGRWLLEVFDDDSNMHFENRCILARNISEKNTKLSMWSVLWALAWQDWASQGLRMTMDFFLRVRHHDQLTGTDRGTRFWQARAHMGAS